MADVIFTACNPRADIACLRQPVGLLRAGRWYDEAALADLRDKAAEHNIGQIVEDLVSGMDAQGTPLDPALLGM